MNKDEKEILLKQIKSLQEDLKKQSGMTQKYKDALIDSNDRIQNITKNLEEGMNLLKSIHRNLIPVDLPEIPYFEFSYKFIPTLVGISGDFFDVIKIKDSLKFAIIISNCNTYAITSLFLSSFLKSSQRSHDFKTADEFILNLSKELPESLSGTDNINVFYGIIDRKDFSLNYCMVGNILAGLQKQGEDLNLFKSCADNLISSPKSLKSETISLNPKDIVLLCSPGIINNTNKEGEPFGMDRLLHATQKRQGEGVLNLRQNILFDIEKFTKDTEVAHDRTVLAMEVKNKILKLEK